MFFLVATNVVASRPPKHRPSGTTHACAKKMCLYSFHSCILGWDTEILNFLKAESFIYISFIKNPNNLFSFKRIILENAKKMHEMVFKEKLIFNKCKLCFGYKIWAYCSDHRVLTNHDWQSLVSLACANFLVYSLQTRAENRWTGGLTWWLGIGSQDLIIYV